MTSKSKTTDSGRRSFLGKLTKTFVLIAIPGQAWMYFRSLFPNVLYEPPKRFKVGLPHEFSEGVSFIDSQGVFVIREGEQFTCISARCTHLGCTVKHVPLDHEQTVRTGGQEMTVSYEFQCPCHGSKFRQNGAAYSGPAPSNLPWHKLEVAPEDGQLVIDKSKTVSSDFKLLV